MAELFTTNLGASLTITTFISTTVISVLLGCLIAFVYSRNSKYTPSFVSAIILMPAIVQTVIMIVNGNIGMGVAVAGAFSLIRFRSMPGNAKDIAVIFMSMATGLASGTGFILIAISFAVTMCLVLVIINYMRIGEKRSEDMVLKLLVPEAFDYTKAFDQVFLAYTAKAQLTNVKTANMGTQYRLTYNIQLKESDQEKAFIDDLRGLDQGLEFSLSHQIKSKDSL